MRKTITTEKIPIKLWLEEIDQDTLQQAKNLANHPSCYHHVAVMPDGHLGYGMPIGGIAATIDSVIPNGVGVDIGCGVLAAQTSLSEIELSVLKKIQQNIRTLIPLGHKHHRRCIAPRNMPELPENSREKSHPIVVREYKRALCQLGTLGGGNHFIEIQKGDDGLLWIMIHSGSRNLGYQVAKHYNNLAVSHTKTKKPNLPSKYQLDYLELRSETGKRYLREMDYCVKFAAANRKTMFEIVENILYDFEPLTNIQKTIDVVHNFAAIERHFGIDLVIHRKGVTTANKGQEVVIPGSQGTASYIAQGLGNPESYSSCSHGAGRILGRRQAQRQLNLKKEIEHLNKQNILHSIRSKKDLDEASGAYKNIKEVMKNQNDLVTIKTELKPLAVIKG